VVVDHFTKFCFIKALPDATAARTIKFLEEDIFKVFGVPETIHSDNGTQFLSKEFQAMIGKYNIRHMKTGQYDPQSNASERLNQSILAAIRTYLKDDHREWDTHLTEIACALRTSEHESIGMAPYYAVFGQHYFGHANDYQLAKQLHALEDNEFRVLSASDKRQILSDKISEKLHLAHEKATQQYNKRAREIVYKSGQEVFKRNFVQSNFSKNINAKFCPKYVKCRIVKPVGSSLYEIEDLRGKPLGTIHTKDLKQ